VLGTLNPGGRLGPDRSCGEYFGLLQPESPPTTRQSLAGWLLLLTMMDEQLFGIHNWNPDGRQQVMRLPLTQLIISGKEE
jgi:hypothetical protein